MDTYINLTTGQYPVTLEEVRKELLTVSLPKHPTVEQMMRLGFCYVQSTPKPAGRHVVERYPRYKDGKFYQTWDVVESTDLNTWRQDLKRQLDQVHTALLKRGFTHEDQPIDLTSSEELNWCYMECQALRDERSTETVQFPTGNGQVMEITWEAGLRLINQAVHYRRGLKRGYYATLETIRCCETIEACKTLKRQIETKEVFQC